MRIIGADNLHELFTWVDAAYGVHDIDMRSHTGGCMSFGTGTVHQKSSKQKINVKSSTEAEVVGTSEYVPYNVWFKNFLEEQGYKLLDNVLFQDNESSIKMETNGRRSCTGNSRHVHIRYFFVKDLIDKKQIRVVYCPTLKMLADFFTKPLQGELYRFFRKIVMGHVSIIDIIAGLPGNKERVEKNEHIRSKYKKKIFSRYPTNNTKTNERTKYVSTGGIYASTDESGTGNKYNDDQVRSSTSKPTYANIVKGNGLKANAH